MGRLPAQHRVLSQSETERCVSHILCRFQTIFPGDFSWKFEMQYPVGCILRWRWLGYEMASEIWRTFSDPNVEILFTLVSQTDWNQERRLFADCYDNAERALLERAQVRRFSAVDRDLALKGYQVKGARLYKPRQDLDDMLREAEFGPV